jgi:hypothetical protein
MKKQTVGKPKGKAPKKTSAQWTAVSRLIRNLEPKEVLDLFRQLYMLTLENAELIDSRFKIGTGENLLEDYRKKIIEELYPGYDPHGKFPRMGWLKNLIRDYRKGTNDLAGTTELMVTFQEKGMEFTMAYGDIDERFYDSLLSGMCDLIKMLTKDAPELFPAFRDRLVKIAQTVYGRIGWGYGDGMYETVAEICDFHGLDFQRTRVGRDFQLSIVAKD